MPRREVPAGVEVRAANTEEMEDFRFIANLALGEHGNPMRDPVTFLQPEWSTCVFEHGALSTTFGAWPFSMRFNGERAHVAGVTAVGTDPTKRRRGYLRLAMEHSLDEQYERGQSLAALYASQAGIYQRFGYAVCSRRQRYELDPLDLSFVQAPTPSGTLSISNARDLPDDAVVIRDLYRQYMQPRNGLLHRGVNLWNAEVLDEPSDIEEGPVRVLLYEEGGEALGYMVYTSREDQSISHFSAHQRDHRMTIREYGWLTPAAYVAMWQFAASQDLSWRIYVRDAPSDDPIQHFARDPRTLRVEVMDGILVRIVDLPRALMTRKYPVESEITFRVLDVLCDWNQGTWRLSVGPEGADIRQVDASPELTMDVFTMAHLATGALSATYSHRLGRIEATDAAALVRADHIFATEFAMHCMNHF
ncbi:MAG: GNAT family N-acetyltransferase [Chloroflexi bacterium]|nr:GNAT family N-acetyltransferase [Chloroflexota bacterium]MYC00461.1 GNAT family N-acetyltransferase [Chloroflexota bacterium]